MNPKLAVAGCSTMTPEFYACARQLGMPLKLYGTPPVCLFGVPVEQVDALLAKAASRHAHLVLALGACCGDLSSLADRHGATRLCAENCRHMYLGPAAYDWCGQHHVLPLPSHCFRRTLRQAREPLGELLGRIIKAQGAERIGAIDDGLRHPDPGGLAQIAEMTGCETFVMQTGLGHLREALRATAASEGVFPTPERALIPPESLGAGDSVLLISTNGEPCLDVTARLFANAVARGMKSVWVMGHANEKALAARLRPNVAHFDELRESGAVRLLSVESLVAEAEPNGRPDDLVRFWKSQALKAMNEGYTGLAVIHGYGWSEMAGLPTDYLLEYTSRLSAACAQWPLMAAAECPPEYYSASVFDELVCTHPLAWTPEGLATTPAYQPSEQYLGAEPLLEALETAPGAFTCQDAAPLISAWVDGELRGQAADLVADHIGRCTCCAEAASGSQSVKTMLRSLRDTTVRPPDDLWDRFTREIGLDT